MNKSLPLSFYYGQRPQVNSLSFLEKQKQKQKQPTNKQTKQTKLKNQTRLYFS